MAITEVSNSPVTATGKAYQTSDGRQFSSYSAAWAHEASLSRGGSSPSDGAATTTTGKTVTTTAVPGTTVTTPLGQTVYIPQLPDLSNPAVQQAIREVASLPGAPVFSGPGQLSQAVLSRASNIAQNTQYANELAYYKALIQELLNQPVQQLVIPQFTWQPPPTLSWEEAQQRAQARLAPLYQQQLQETLKNVEQDLIRRGFFGQMPSVPITREEAARIEAAKNAAIASLAQEMVGQSEEAARRAEELAQQRWAMQANLALQAWQAAREQRQDKLTAALNLLNLLQQQREAEQEREQERWKALLPWTQGLTPAEAAQLALQEAGITGYYKGQPTLEREKMAAEAALNRMRIAASTGGGSSSGGSAAAGPPGTGKPTATQVKNTYRDAMADIDKMISEQVPLTQILQYIDRNREILQMYGVDINWLKDWAKTRATGNPAYIDRWQWALPQ